MSSTVKVFDPALCCSTGVCGPTTDAALPKIAADLEWLRQQGVTVTRFNLAQEPAAFAADATVRRALEEGGVDRLPLVIVDGRVLTQGAYPDRAALAAAVGVASACCAPAASAASACCAPEVEAASSCCAPAPQAAKPRAASGGCC